MNASQNRQRTFRGKGITFAKLTKHEQIKASVIIVYIFFGKYRKNKQRQVQNIIAINAKESMPMYRFKQVTKI
jgi:hypothetical protein